MAAYTSRQVEAQRVALQLTSRHNEVEEYTMRHYEPFENISPTLACAGKLPSSMPGLHERDRRDLIRFILIDLALSGNDAQRANAYQKRVPPAPGTELGTE